MRFATPLVPATLIRRYKRFLSDVVLEDGTEVVAHCPNPGAMTGLAEPGTRIWLEPNDNPKKKLKYGWRLTELPDGHMAGIDTGVPNRVVGEALRAGLVPGLSGDVRAEVKYGTNSRVDFLLSDSGVTTYVEVKNCHLRRSGTLAEFPDCVTLRGAKHMEELAEVARQGHRAVLIFLVQRTDCTSVAVADDIDPGYARAFDAARTAGVEVIALSSRITVDGVESGPPLPVSGG
ncbi:sugar fermentation stimulation protein A [Jannaschia faecimaris]|uniref:Sugar fermentation stimulation protein homolog n=1 Tax=Jannaschia faecimaris TaxID=1244108 RepID=A0A1H3J371_9RHOB|nr:DNA/RNA nuclease SfsA [Jannaschia faecimaris]SDY34045.1 sugar fermentation stimulation protein A [Jannaschia faecimaris]